MQIIAAIVMRLVPSRKAYRIGSVRHLAAMRHHQGATEPVQQQRVQHPRDAGSDRCGRLLQGSHNPAELHAPARLVPCAPWKSARSTLSASFPRALPLTMNQVS